MKINVKSKGTQPTCQMPFVLSCEHCIFMALRITAFHPTAKARGLSQR